MDNYVIDTATFQLTQSEFIVRALVALGIGIIIGLEREHASIVEKAHAFAGIRTFVLVVLLGFIGGMTYYLFSPLVYLGILFAVSILTGVSYFITATRGDIGSTTEFSLIISFLLGTLCFIGFLDISLMFMVVVLVVLSSKPRAQTIIGKISGEELYDFIRYVIIALLLFPFLPNQNLGPNGVLNPREIGWVIILTSGLGFVGYILMKFLGARKGILFSGLVGGLISSTAVTWVFAKKSKENEILARNCAVAIMAASSIMVLRVLLWTYVFNEALFNAYYYVIFLVFLAAVGVTLFIYFKRDGQQVVDTHIRQGKPLDLQGALVFGSIYTGILLVVNYANEHLGQEGLLISSAISGLSDIDAITITVSKLASQKLDFHLAANALLVATISNTLIKMGIGIWAGSRSLRHYLLLGYGIIFLTALVALVILD
ncbi:MAG: MgtC/SapB family protein [Saprospiraceae bacterium]|nr:MgtC/SapB family protein [Saprospiraceae bacterium]